MHTFMEEINVFIEPTLPQSSAYTGLLKIPGVIIVYVQLVAAGLAITYLDPTLAPFLVETVSKRTLGIIYLAII